METVTLKLQKETSDEINRLSKRYHYGTKTEFIREAIRDKIKQLEAEKFMQKLARYKGSATVNLNDEKLHKNREEIANRYLKKFNLD